MEEEKKKEINLDELKPMKKPYKMYATVITKEEKARVTAIKKARLQ